MNKKIVTVLLISVLIVLLYSPITVYADNKDYDVSKYTINVVINPDGSADIEEAITYRFDGEFNGVFRDVDFSSTGGIVNAKVFVKRDGGLTELQLNSTKDLDARGKNGTYNLVIEGELARFKIYEKSEDEDKSFVFTYTFEDVVTKYNDIAEFNRKMIDPNWDVALNNISINFTLPEGAARDEIKVFGHGSLLGESKIIDEGHVRFKVPNVKPGEMVETLVLFPTRLVPQSTKIINKDALPRIMANEKVLAEEANKRREEAKKQQARKAMMRSIGNTLTVVFSIAWLGIIIVLYRKYDKEFKHSFEGKYYRELPGDYTPAEMSILLSMGNVLTRDVTATLMDLVRKKQLILSSEKALKKRLFKSSEVNEYTVSRNPKAPDISLKKHEAFLMNWFIDTLGDGNSVNLDTIAEYAKTESKARKFKKDYDKWCELAKKEADKNGFFEKIPKKGIGTGVAFSLLYLLLGVLILLIFSTAAGSILIVLFIILFIFSVRIGRRTAYGNEQKAMWDAFKNFLKDFSRLDKATMPSIVIWEHYLVYAISLGVAKEVIKQLPLVFNDADLHDSGLTFMYGHNSYLSFAILSNALDRTVDSVNGAISNAMSVADSTLSSSSGGGGGFSGGSSGGGGGGGGGGAF